jgi:hypothetical protein
MRVLDAPLDLGSATQAPMTAAAVPSVAPARRATAVVSGPPRTPAPPLTPAPAQAQAAEAALAPLRPGEGPPRPKVGRYTFHSQGSRQVGPGASPQPFDDNTTMDVSITGDDEIQRTQSGNGSAEIHLRFARDGLLLVRTRARSGAFQFDQTFDPPQLIVRWPLYVGEEWTGSFRSDKYDTEGTYHAHVLRRENAALVGRDLVTYVISSEVRTTGQLSGTIAATLWYSPEVGLTVHRITDADESYAGYPFKSHSEDVLTGTP